MADADDTDHTPTKPRLWRQALVVVVVVVVILGLGVALTRRPERGRFCTADAMIGPDGKAYGRDADQDCQFVDENGKVVPFPLTTSTVRP